MGALRLLALMGSLVVVAAGCAHGQGPPPPLPAPGKPEGYAEVTVMGVAPTDEGNAAILADAQTGVVLPIFIGGTEGLVIHQRLAKQPFPRPMTHDLLEAALREAGCTILQVRIDDLVDNVFIGSILVRQGTRLFKLDARPSDGIALALGSKVPIYVARRVLERAGLRKDALPPAPPQST